LPNSSKSTYKEGLNTPEYDDEKGYLTVSQIMEYYFCPRFIYFIHCLNIPQHEELRYKVLVGRELHRKRQRTNPCYLWRKLKCVERYNDVHLFSHRYKIKGVVDVVLVLSDGTAAPLDFKFATFNKTIYRTHKYQSLLYGIMITEMFSYPVSRGFVCYTRSGNLIKTIAFSPHDLHTVRADIQKIKNIITTGRLPSKRSGTARCIDCCYKNICPK